jgi:hypothetical protein
LSLCHGVKHNVISRVLTGERQDCQRQRSWYDVRESERFEDEMLLTLNMEEGAASQGLQTALELEKPENTAPLERPEEMQLY